MKKIFILIFINIFSFASNVWHKNNLFDTLTMSYYIPHELWLKIPWDGKKEYVFHKIESQGSLKGFFNWYHPYLKTHIKVYKKNSNSNSELFTLYPKGIAKVYDKQNEAYLSNGLNFPAGLGWKRNTIYQFTQEVWVRNRHYTKILGLKITDINFKNDILDFITYDYYIDGKLFKSYSIKPTIK